MKAIDRIGLKIERADKHVRDLNTALDTFYATNPCGIAKKIDSQTREPIYYVSRLADIPTSISIIAGDVLNNLRSALDHLAYSLVAVGTGKTLSKQVSFPIADSAAQYKSIQFRRKIEGAGQDPIKRLDALKPYKGGNDTLWHLGQLNNIDKHRLLLTASTRYTFRSMTLNDYARMLITHPKLDYRTLKGLVRWTNFGGPTGPLKVGDVIYVRPSIELDKDMKFKFEVAFNEPQIMECQSVSETVYIMLKVVEGIIPRFSDLL